MKHNISSVTEHVKWLQTRPYQLYMIRGFKSGEGLLLAWTLPPSKMIDTYRELFGCLRVVDAFVVIGNY